MREGHNRGRHAHFKYGRPCHVRAGDSRQRSRDRSVSPENDNIDSNVHVCTGRR